MLDETPTTQASRTLASTITPAARAGIRRARAALAVNADAARVRHAVLERDAAAAMIRDSTTAKARTARTEIVWRWQDRLEARRDGLAARFAARHHLTPSRRRFGPDALAEAARIDTHSTVGQADPAGAWPYPEGDHVEGFVRRDGLAACAVAHVYCVSTSPAEVRAMCEAFAARAGLGVTFPHFPSWWFPGETMLVAYWPGDAGDMF